MNKVHARSNNIQVGVSTEDIINSAILIHLLENNYHRQK